MTTIVTMILYSSFYYFTNSIRYDCQGFVSLYELRAILVDFSAIYIKTALSSHFLFTLNNSSSFPGSPNH